MSREREKADELRVVNMGDRRLAVVDKLVDAYEVTNRSEAMRRLLDDIAEARFGTLSLIFAPPGEPARAADQAPLLPRPAPTVRGRFG